MLGLIIVACTAEAQMDSARAPLNDSSHVAASLSSNGVDDFGLGDSVRETFHLDEGVVAQDDYEIMIDGTILTIPERVLSLSSEFCPLPPHLPLWRKGIAYLAQVFALTTSEKNAIYQFLPAAVRRILQP